MRINDRFEIRRDAYCWILVEHIATDQTRKNVKRASREYHTFHANPEQACREVLNRTGGDCDTAAELVREWRKAVSAISDAFSEGVTA